MSWYYPYSSYIPSYYPYFSYYYPYYSYYYPYYSRYYSPYLSYLETQNTIRRSRLEADLAASRATSQISLRQSLRRLRLENQIDAILGRY